MKSVGPLFCNAVNRRAGFAPRRLADNLEHAVKALHLPLCLTFMLCESGLKVPRLRGLGHLWQGLQDLVLSEIDILECLMKEILKFLRFCSHVVLP